MPRRLELIALVWLGCGGCLLAPCDDGPASEPPTAEKQPQGQRLRFRPTSDLSHNLYAVHDLQVPGAGVLHTAASLRVTHVATEGTGHLLDREIITWQNHSNDEPVPGPELAGIHLRLHYGRDRELLQPAEVAGEVPQNAAVVAKAGAAIMRIGRFIEYPERRLQVGDSWTIEPRRLDPWPGIFATMRPSFTVNEIEGERDQAVAEVGTDMEMDLVPMPITEGFTLKGTGSASGSFRVRLKDGVVLESNVTIRFSQELTTDAAAVVGYQEFTGHAQTFIDEPGEPAPDLTARQHEFEPTKEDARCNLALSSLGQRLSKLPRHQAMVFAVTLDGVKLARAPGGQPIASPGTSLVLPRQGPALLNALPVERGQLASALRTLLRTDGEEPAVVYLYVDAEAEASELRSMLGKLTRGVELRLVVRDPDSGVQLPQAGQWQQERVRQALAEGDPLQRIHKLDQLLRGHMGLCGTATKAYLEAIASGKGWQGFVDALSPAYLECGCDTVDLAGLEASVHQVVGTPDLRWLRLERLPRKGQLSELATSLAPAVAPAVAPATGAEVPSH